MKYSYQTLLTVLISLSLLSCSEKPSEKNSATAATLEFANPEDVGLVADSLAKIDKMIRRYVDKGRFPGAVVLIAKDGKIVYETEVGWSDSLRQQPYTKENLFRMASMTKPYTSVAAMQLYEQGRLDLNDPVAKYIPEFAKPEVYDSFNAEDTSWTSRPAHREPTVANLLTHTAGVPYGFMNPGFYGAVLAKYDIPDLATPHNWTLEEKMAVIGKLPLAHDPGERWMYGLNTDVLGRVVEVASGQNLQDYFREHITRPLGSNDMDFYFEEARGKEVVKTYIAYQDTLIRYFNDNDGGRMYAANYPYEGAKTYFSGGSGLTGTARDYYKFCQMMLNDGSYRGQTLLQPTTAQLMHTDHIDTLSYPWGQYRFGYGFDVAKDHPVRPDGTYSWGGAFSTVFWIDPANDLIAIMLSQVLFSPERGMANEFEQLVYEALP